MKHPLKWTLAIAVLVVLNVWRWWPQDEGPAAQATGELSASDLRLRQAQLDSRHTRTTRDLFFASTPVSTSRPVSAAKPSTRPAARPAREDPKTAAGSQMAQYELTAVAKRSGDRHALVARNGEHHTVIEGDVLDGRYLVKTITPQTLELRDQTTGAAVTLRLGNEQ